MSDLEADRIRRAIGDCPIGSHLVFVDETGSTNDLAAQLAATGAPHGTLVVARRQTAGRGRRGRHWWHDPEHGLAISIALRPSRPARSAPELVHVAALAVDDTACGCGVDARIKWPNDIVVEVAGSQRKLAGILVESSLRGDQIERAVVGIGLNVNTAASDFAAAAGSRAISLGAISGQTHDRAQLIAECCRQLQRWLERWQADGLAALRDQLVRRSATLGRPVQVVVDGRSVAGRAVDLALDGALRVEDASGQRFDVREPFDAD